jgi:hypothetical protein
MSDYFPAYEVAILEYATLFVNREPYVDLLRNTSGTTNYVSFIQPYFVDSTSTVDYNQFDLSDYMQTISIRNKTATNYRLFVGSDLTADAIGLGHQLWCITFYNYQTEVPLINKSRTPISTSNPYLNYKINNAPFDPFIYFPQYIIQTTALTTSSGNFTFTNTYGAKIPPDTTYFIAGSVENEGASSSNKLGVKQLMYYENPKSATSNQIYISNNVNVTIKVNTITLCFPNPQTRTLTSNYNVRGTPLELTVPMCETFNISISSTSGSHSGTFTLLHNTRGTDRYVVLSSYRYVSAGSSSTYNPHEGSSAAKELIINNKTATTFSYAFVKNTGDIWNGGVMFLVIYY